MSTRASDAGLALRGTVAHLALQSTTRLVALAFVAVATRSVEGDVFGRYSVVTAIVLIGGFLADCGTTPALTRLVSADEGEADTLLRGTLPLSLGLGLLSWSGAVAFALLAGYPHALVVDVVVGGAALPLGAVATSMLGVLDGAGRTSARAVLTAVQGLLVAGLGAVTVVITKDVRLAAVALAVAPLAPLVGATVLLRRRGLWSGRWAVDGAAVGRVFRLAGPLALSGGVSALTMRLDVLILSVLSDPADTAGYDLAVRGIESVAFVSMAIAVPLLPVLASRTATADHDGVRRAYAATVRAAYLLGLPISALLAVLGGPMARTLVGPGYGGVAGPMAILGGCYVLQFVGAVQGTLAMATGWLVPGVKRAVLSLVGMTALDLVLIPRWGGSGAAVAAVAASLFLALSLAALFRAGGVPTPAPPLRALLATGAMVAVALALRTVPVVAVIAAMATYASVLLAAGELRGPEVRELVGRLRRAPLSGPA